MGAEGLLGAQDGKSVRAAWCHAGFGERLGCVELQTSRVYAPQYAGARYFFDSEHLGHALLTVALPAPTKCVRWQSFRFSCRVLLCLSCRLHRVWYYFHAAGLVHLSLCCRLGWRFGRHLVPHTAQKSGGDSGVVLKSGKDTSVQLTSNLHQVSSFNSCGSNSSSWRRLTTVIPYAGLQTNSTSLLRTPSDLYREEPLPFKDHPQQRSQSHRHLRPQRHRRHRQRQTTDGISARMTLAAGRRLSANCPNG